MRLTFCQVYVFGNSENQVAKWGNDEVAWVDQNLEGFKGRVSRDGWVAQAKRLAAGEETEFSSRAKKRGG